MLATAPSQPSSNVGQTNDCCLGVFNTFRKQLPISGKYHKETYNKENGWITFQKQKHVRKKLKTKSTKPKQKNKQLSSICIINVSTVLNTRYNWYNFLELSFKVSKT